MSRRLLVVLMGVVLVAGLSAFPAAAATSAPTGERIVGGQNGHGGTVIEPVYDDMTGATRYVSTPQGTAHPVPTNPRATAPFYLPVYPGGPLAGDPLAGVTLNCQDVPTENCPDHGPTVAMASQQIMQNIDPSVYGLPGTPGGVIGHDHLMAGPGSHGDFNVAWVPTLVLFTDRAFVTHITTLDQLRQLNEKHEVLEVPLNGSNNTPNLTFHCSVVSASVYAHGVPFTL